MKGAARRGANAGLLLLVLLLRSAGDARPVRAASDVAPVPSAGAPAGSADLPAGITAPAVPLPAAVRTDASAPDTVPPAGPPPPGVPEERLPSDEELAARGAVIGEVVVRNENIFDIADPRENNRLFRLVNRLHAKTRPWLIRNQLLFRTGDRYDRRILDESERILRSNRYFYDARIRPVAFREGRVDIEVLTRDVWTLRPGFSFGRQGGANTTSLELSDSNLLGTGVGMEISHASTPDRNTDSFFLESKQIGDTRLRASLLIAENSDGRKRSALLERPFYALDARWSAGADFVDDIRTDTIFGRVGVAGQFQTHSRKWTARGGWSAGLKGRWARRFLIGFAFDESRFSPAPGYISADPVPPDRVLAYPWVGFELVEDDFEKAKNRDQIMRTEDFYLGTRCRASAGYSSDRFGADREAAILSGRLETSIEASDSSIALLDGGADGRIESGTVRNAILRANGRLYARLSGSWLIFSLLSGSRGTRLDPDRELALGGENGLRGYPRRYQAGDRSALFTLEGRYYTSLYPFRLVRVGGAVFFDMGRAWGKGFAKAQDPGVLRNVGVGLRLGITRSGLGNIIHLDAAFPLDGDPTISRVQFLVTTKQSF